MQKARSITFFLLLGLLFAGGFNVTHASYNLASSSPNDQVENTLTYKWAQIFTAQSDGKLDYITAYNFADNVGMYASIYTGNNPNSLGTLLATTTIGRLRNDGDGSGIFIGNANVTAGTTYTLIIQNATSTANNNLAVVSRDNSTFGIPNYSAYRYSATSTTYVQLGIARSLNFNLYGSTPTDTPATLSFLYPPNASSLYGDFSHFQLSFINGDHALSGYPYVVYGENSNPTHYNDTGVGASFTPNATTTFYVQKTHISQGSTTARGYLLSPSGAIIASTTQITFSITGAFTQNTGSFNPFVPNPFASTTDPNATSSIFFVDCSEYANVTLFSSGTFANAYCLTQKATMWTLGKLITPPDWINGFWNDSIDQMQNVFPFNIVFGVLNNVKQSASAMATSTETNSLYLTIPQLNINTPLLTSSTLQNAVGVTWKNTIFEWITNITWLATGVAVVALIL